MLHNDECGMNAETRSLLEAFASMFNTKTSSDPSYAQWAFEGAMFKSKNIVNRNESQFY